MKQAWCCTQCGRSGVAEFPDHAGVWAALAALLASHERKQPACKGGRETIRIKNCSGMEWRETKRAARLSAMQKAAPLSHQPDQQQE